MKVFLSYSSSDTEIAEDLVEALRLEGHRVFFDKDKLQAGNPIHKKIRRSIEISDVFIFLISPYSTREGSYALSELDIARRLRRPVEDRVIGVLVSHTPKEHIPSLLRSIGFLRPSGSTVAETTRRIEELAKAKNRRTFSSIIIIVTIISLASIISARMIKWGRPFGESKYTEHLPPPPHPPAEQPVSGTESLLDELIDRAHMANTGEAEAFFDDTISTLRTNCKEARTDAQCWLRLGQLLSVRTDYKGALEAFEIVRKLMPRRSEPYTGLATVYYQVSLYHMISENSYKIDLPNLRVRLVPDKAARISMERALELFEKANELSSYFEVDLFPNEPRTFSPATMEKNRDRIKKLIDGQREDFILDGLDIMKFSTMAARAHKGDDVRIKEAIELSEALFLDVGNRPEKYPDLMPEVRDVLAENLGKERK